MKCDTLSFNSTDFCATRGGDPAEYRAGSPACVGSIPSHYGFHGSEPPMLARAHFTHPTMVSKATKQRRQQQRSSSRERGADGRFISSTPGGISALADDDPTVPMPTRTYSAVAASTPTRPSTAPSDHPPVPTPIMSSDPSLSTPSGTPTNTEGSSVLALYGPVTLKSQASSSTHNAGSGASGQDGDVEDASLSQSSFPRRFFSKEEIADMRRAEADIAAALKDESRVELHRDLQAILDEHDSEMLNGSLTDIAPPVPEIKFNDIAKLMDRFREDKKAMKEMMDTMTSIEQAFDARSQYWENMDTCIQRKVERVQEMLDVQHIQDLVTAPVRREVMAIMASRPQDESSGFQTALDALQEEGLSAMTAAVDRHKLELFVLKDDNEVEFRSTVETLRLNTMDTLRSFRDDINSQIIATGQAHIERIKHMSADALAGHSGPNTPTPEDPRQADNDEASFHSSDTAAAPCRFDHRGYPITSRGGPATGVPRSDQPRQSVTFAPQEHPDLRVMGCDSDRMQGSGNLGAEDSVLGERDRDAGRSGPKVSFYDAGAEDGVSGESRHFGPRSSSYDTGAEDGVSGEYFGVTGRDQQYQDHRMERMDYHGGQSGLRDGVFLTGFYLRHLGFTNQASFPEVSRLHRIIRQNWFHKSNNTYGPQRETILNSKALQKLALSRFDARSVVSWYERMVTTCEAYKIGLMPFDAIQFSRGATGLCLPGLGTDRYTDMASALCSVLQVCFANASNRVLTMAATVESRSRNGYDILWRFLRLYVPGFDPSKIVERPLWSSVDGDVIRFANEFDLYFRLSEKNGHGHSDVVKSTLFLKGITEPAMMKVVEPLLIAVESAACSAQDDGTLPARLRYDELAIKISERMVVEPLDSRVMMASTKSHPVCLDGGSDAEDDDPPPHPPRLFATSSGGRFGSGAGPTPNKSRGFESTSRKSFDRGQHKTDLTRRPDPMHRIRSPVADSICEACGKRGHVASTCDFLAMSVCNKKFIKQGKLTDTMAREVEKRWLEKWSSRGGKPHTTPSKVYAAVTEMYGLSLEELDAEIDWQCWPLNVELDE